MSAACIMALLSLAAPADDDADAAAAWTAVMQSSPQADRERKMAAVLAACGSDPAALARLIRADTVYPRLPAGWQRHRLAVPHGPADGAAARTTPVDVWVRPPRTYDPARPWPAVLLAHGQGGDGRHIGTTFERLLGRRADAFVLIAPTLPGAPVGFKPDAFSENVYLHAVDWARHRVNLDDDRLYLTGYSQGGHVTWHLAALFPWRFAAAAPVAGAPIFEGYPATTTLYLSNLRLLPTWAIWGELDGASGGKIGNVDLCRQALAETKRLKLPRFRHAELKGRGHGGCWPAGEELAKFFLAARRSAPPDRVHHVFHSPRHGRAWYLQAKALARTPIDFRKPVRIALPPGARPDQQTMQQHLARHARRALFTLDATRQTKANALHIRAVGIRTVRVFVQEGLFDLGGPVTISLNGRTWRGRVAASARCLLTHYLATRDATRLVLNEIEITTTGKATVRYK